MVFTIISISYLPEHLELLLFITFFIYHTTLDGAIGSILLPASRAILARGRLAVNKVHFPLPVSGVQQAASHSGQVLLTPKSCQQNQLCMQLVKKSFPSN